MKKKFPKLYFSTTEVAQMTGKSTEAARKWLKRNGAARKVGGRWLVSVSRLAASFPEAFQELGR